MTFTIVNGPIRLHIRQCPLGQRRRQDVGVARVPKSSNVAWHVSAAIYVQRPKRTLLGGFWGMPAQENVTILHVQRLFLRPYQTFKRGEG